MTELSITNILLPDHGPVAEPAETAPALAAMFALMLAGQAAPPAQAAVPMPVATTPVADDAPAGEDGAGDGTGAGDAAGTDTPTDAVLSLPIMGPPVLPVTLPVTLSRPDVKTALPVSVAGGAGKTVLAAAAPPPSVPGGQAMMAQEVPVPATASNDPPAPTAAPADGDRRLTAGKLLRPPSRPLVTPDAPDEPPKPVPPVRVQLAPNIPDSVLMAEDAKSPAATPAPPRGPVQLAPNIPDTVLTPSPEASPDLAARTAVASGAWSPRIPASAPPQTTSPAASTTLLAEMAIPAADPAPTRRTAMRDGDARVADIAASPAAPAAIAVATPDQPAAVPLPDRVAAHRLDLAAGDRWLDQLARDIAQTAGNDGQLRFRLNPEHLGSLHVEVSHGADGASVRLSADSEAARAILADARPRLIAEAQAQGVRIAEAQVGGGTGQSPRQGEGGRPHQPFVQHAAAPPTPAKNGATVTVDEPIGAISERYA